MDNSSPKKVLIITGETSGDMHAARLIKETHQILPLIQFFGVGGKHMQEAGANIIFDTKNLAVIGILEILSQLKYILQAFRIIRRFIIEKKPDALVLIDYAGFNLRIAKVAKTLGVKKIIYYIGPQVWASRARRIKKIKQYVDKILVIFPFEVEIYQQAQVPVEFVGHPLANTVKPNIDLVSAREYFKIPEGYKVVGLLPGSRKGEIKRLLPALIKTAELLQNYDKNIQFILPLAQSLELADIEPYLKNTSIQPKIIQNNFYDAMQLCNAAIVASGTATLEVALLGIPLVIIYKTSWLTYQIAKRVVKTPYIGLCNIVAGKKVAVELIQNEAEPEKICSEVKQILEDSDYHQIMQQNLQNIRIKLSQENNTVNAATALIKALY